MSDTYVRAVLAGGGLPLVLPLQRGNAAALIDRIDGLLLSGGGDIAPHEFGDSETHPATYGVDPLRDAFEFELIAEARRRDFPMLCICRGVQVLNVAYGGTLYQHVPDDVPGEVGHRQQEAGIPGHEIGHTVEVRPATTLADLTGAGELGVNSFHHQAIKDVASDLEIAAVSDDGLVEAIVAPQQTFFVGVQWHPEMMFEHHDKQLRLFQALSDAAIAHRLSSVAAS